VGRRIGLGFNFLKFVLLYSNVGNRLSKASLRYSTSWKPKWERKEHIPLWFVMVWWLKIYGL
jgi:hypothetical protein